MSFTLDIAFYPKHTFTKHQLKTHASNLQARFSEASFFDIFTSKFKSGKKYLISIPGSVLLSEDASYDDKIIKINPNLATTLKEFLKNINENSKILDITGSWIGDKLSRAENIEFEEFILLLESNNVNQRTKYSIL